MWATGFGRAQAKARPLHMANSSARAPARTSPDFEQPKLLIILKGYPRISETFIAQELFGLQEAGLQFDIISLRHPYDDLRHPVHDRITAPVSYLPEYLYQEPLRVMRSLLTVATRQGFWRALRQFLRDVRRDLTPNRGRRFGQAAVLAAEAPAGSLWLHAHFAHTPASVARYAGTMLGAPFTISAHAKDIWTSPDWELSEKLTEARWTVTCTESGRAHLQDLAPESPVHLSYHGLDLDRFPSPTHAPPDRDGSDPSDPVRILTVGRAVPKKGFDTILEALERLPKDLKWRLEHVGRGPELARLKAEAEAKGFQDRIDWRGMQEQTEVLAAYRQSDIFVLASHAAGDGDRDGLPNVIVEAASQRLACVATDFSAIPELIQDGASGLLVPPRDPAALSKALETVIRDPDLREQLGRAAERKVRTSFDFRPGIQQLKILFTEEWSRRD